jgi:predicted Zn-dependent protease
VAPALFAGGEGVRRRSSRRFLVGITLLALVPLLVVVALLASLDHLTDRVVARIPPSVERQIGAAVLARTRLEGRLIDQGPAFEAVQAIGRRLARPGETLEFHLTERPEINAFAAPGGVVVVNSGLLKRAASAEEVAGVLAHEIAHVELRHSLRQIVRSAGLRVIFGALAGDYDALGGWAAQLGELKFSRDAEREADRRGLERLAEARVDPAGMLRFFETLEKAEAGGKAGQLPALLSTHPATQERIIWLREATTTAGGGPVEPLAIDWRAVAGSLR